MKIGKQFQKEFRKRLAFLMTTHDFREAVLSDGEMTYRILFFSQDIALMFELEVREHVIFDMVLYRQNGMLPEYPYRDASGNNLAYYVPELIFDFLSTDPDFAQLTVKRDRRRKEWQRWTEKYLMEEAEYYETLFRKYGREIFARAREQFGLPPEP